MSGCFDRKLVKIFFLKLNLSLARLRLDNIHGLIYLPFGQVTNNLWLCEPHIDLSLKSIFLFLFKYFSSFQSFYPCKVEMD